MASTIVLPARLSSTMQLDQPLLGARVERRGRLVEQQHLGVHDEHRARWRPASSDRPTAGTAPGRRGRRSRACASVSSTRPATSSVARPMLSGPKAISSRTVGEKTWASEFWKMKPTRERKPAENCSSSRSSSVIGWPKARTCRRRGRAARRAPSAASTCRSRWRRAAPPSRRRRTESDTSIEGREAAEVAVAQRMAGQQRAGRAGRRSRGRRSAAVSRGHGRSRARRRATTQPATHTTSSDRRRAGRKRAGVAGVATRHHRQVHLLGQGVGLAEQRAGRWRPRTAVPSRTSDVGPTGHGPCGPCTCRSPSRGGGTGSGRPCRGRGRTSSAPEATRSAASSRVHGVVSVSSTTSEIDVATRVTMIAAPCRPSLVTPTGVPNHVPSGTTIVPGRDEAQAWPGSTTMPVKIGMNSQTRLTKNGDRESRWPRRAPAWPRRWPASTTTRRGRRR